MLRRMNAIAEGGPQLRASFPAGDPLPEGGGEPTCPHPVP